MVTKFIIVGALILNASFVFAEYPDLPEPLVGQTEVTQYIGGSLTPVTYYGATSGNETVYNPEATDLGFNRDAMIACFNSIIISTTGQSIESCFKKDPINEKIFDIMTSRTYYNNIPSVEVAALFYYPEPYIKGDAYLGNMEQNSFNYYGRNLTSGRDSAAASDKTHWGLSGFELNKSAQATLSGDEYGQYKNKINTLLGEAQEISDLDWNSSFSQNIYLQGKLMKSQDDEKNNYPEGKIWKKDSDAILSGTITYSGKGTLIIGGSLAIKPNTKIIKKTGETDARLGIIVLGDEGDANITIGGNCDITASIFTPKNIQMTGSNTTMTGSFVASEFTNLEAPDLVNIWFIYDPALDTGWPPGFRYLNMPKPAR